MIPTGDNVMILGLAVLPKYRGIGVGIRTDAAVFRDTKAAGEMCVDPDMS